MFGILKGHSILPVTDRDRSDLLEFLFIDFRVNEPLNRSVSLTREDVGETFTEVIDFAIRGECSFVIRNETDDIVGCILSKEVSIAELRAESACCPSLNGPLSKIMRLLWQLEQKVLDFLPEKAETLLKVQIISVSSQCARQGLGSLLLSACVNAANERNLLVYTEVTARASQKLFAKHSFRVLHEIFHSTYLDENRKQIFMCEDGTDRAQLVANFQN